jgi:hypothetical protein
VKSAALSVTQPIATILRTDIALFLKEKKRLNNQSGSAVPDPKAPSRARDGRVPVLHTHLPCTVVAARDSAILRAVRHNQSGG